MIKKTSLSRLNNNELNTLVTRLIEAIKPVESLNGGILAKIIVLIAGLNAKLTKSLNTSLKSVYTEALKNLDTLRDDAFRAIRDAILACSQRLNDTYRMHANKLLQVFKTHGWSLWRENYQEESAKMNSLIVELDGSDAQASLSAIQLTDWYLELKKAQTDFEETFQLKASKDERDNYIAINTIRPDLMKKTNELLDRLNTEIQYAENPDIYNELVKSINNILDETMVIAKSRATRKEKEIPEDENDD